MRGCGHQATNFGLLRGRRRHGDWLVVVTARHDARIGLDVRNRQPPRQVSQQAAARQPREQQPGQLLQHEQRQQHDAAERWLAAATSERCQDGVVQPGHGQQVHVLDQWPNELVDFENQIIT